MAELLCVNGGGERVCVGQLQVRSHTYCGGAAGEREVDRDRLDAEANEHRVDALGPRRACVAERSDQDFAVVDGRDQQLRPGLERVAHPLDGLGVVGVLAAEVGDEDVCIEDGYGHSSRSSSR